MTRRITSLLALVLGLVVVAPTAAPSPAGAAPAKTFTTDESSAEHDVAPGDGVCATSLGGCSLQAALDEAIALRKGTIVVDAEGSAAGTAVRGNISVRGARRLTQVDLAGLRVERGATLTLSDLELVAEGATSFLVRGRLVVERTAYLAGESTLRIDPSGTAVIRNTLVLLDGALRNMGALRLEYSNLRVPPGHTGIQTAADGVTTLAASYIFGETASGTRACGGNVPVSEGYNAARDGSCRLTHPTDLGVFRDTDDLTPQPESPRTDAIPPGAVGCGTTVVEDQARRPRPADGDGDGDLGCDVGWSEVPPPEPEAA